MNNRKIIKTTINALVPLINEAFENGQDVSIKIKGTSMSPFFVDNQTEVLLSKFEGELQKLKVYFFVINDNYILHRYLYTKHDRHYFRGDATSEFEVVQIEDICGVVKEMKYMGEIISCNNISYRNNVRYYLFKKSIKLFIRRIIKGK